jgi:uncharacterized protein
LPDNSLQPQKQAPADEVLSADEAAALRASVQAVGRRVAGALAQAGSATAAVQTVVLLHKGADALAARAAADAEQPPLACKPGCAHCCRLLVHTTQPEVFALAQHMQQWPADQLATAVQRLQERVAAPAEPEGFCALLVNQRCSVYAVRPAACRKAHSLDVRACETRAAVVPQNLQLVLDTTALVMGTQAGYRAAGLACDALELNAALLAALLEPGAVQSWYVARGEGTDYKLSSDNIS